MDWVAYTIEISHCFGSWKISLGVWMREPLGTRGILNQGLLQGRAGFDVCVRLGSCQESQLCLLSTEEMTPSVLHSTQARQQ